MTMKLSNKQGFSLMELVIVMAIMSVLSSIAMLYINDLLKTTRDATALAEGQNIMQVVTNQFLDRVSVSYASTSPSGLSSISIGTAMEDGTTARAPVLTLSPGVKIIFNGLNISYGGANMASSFSAFLYHVNGSDSPWSPSGKRGIQVIVDEATNIQEYIMF